MGGQGGAEVRARVLYARPGEWSLERLLIALIASVRCLRLVVGQVSGGGRPRNEITLRTCAPSTVPHPADYLKKWGPRHGGQAITLNGAA